MFNLLKNDYIQFLQEQAVLGDVFAHLAEAGSSLHKDEEGNYSLQPSQVYEL